MQSDLKDRIRENLIMLDTYHTVLEFHASNLLDHEEFWGLLDKMQTRIGIIADLCGLDYEEDIVRDSTVRAVHYFLQNKEDDE